MKIEDVESALCRIVHRPSPIERARLADELLIALRPALAPVTQSIGVTYPPPPPPPPPGSPTCPLCRGTGKAIEVDAIRGDGSLENPRPASCMVCNGTGVPVP